MPTMRQKVFMAWVKDRRDNALVKTDSATSTSKKSKRSKRKKRRKRRNRKNREDQ